MQTRAHNIVFAYIHVHVVHAKSIVIKLYAHR